MGRYIGSTRTLWTMISLGLLWLVVKGKCRRPRLPDRELKVRKRLALATPSPPSFQKKTKTTRLHLQTRKRNQPLWQLTRWPRQLDQDETTPKHTLITRRSRPRDRPQ